MANKSKGNNINVSKTNTTPCDILGEEDIPTFDEKRPAAIYIFFFLCMCAAFSMVILFGISSSSFPWQALLIGASILAGAIGIWLWGYYSHKPGTIIKVVYVAKPPRKRTSTTSEIRKSKQELSKAKKLSNPKVAGKLDEIFNDPDLQDSEKVAPKGNAKQKANSSEEAK